MTTVCDDNIDGVTMDPHDSEYIHAVEDPALREVIRCTVTTYRRADRLSVGDPAPVVELVQLGSRQTIKLTIGARPLVLFFGSYT